MTQWRPSALTGMRSCLCLVVFVSACGPGMKASLSTSHEHVATLFASFYGEPKAGCEFRHHGDGLYIADNCRTDRCDSATLSRGELCTHNDFRTYQCRVVEALGSYGIDCQHLRCPNLGVDPSEKEIEQALRDSRGQGYWGCYTVEDRQPLRWETRGSLTWNGYYWR